jgi:hypothetical protein
VTSPTPPHGRDESGPYTRAINCCKKPINLFLYLEQETGLLEEQGLTAKQGKCKHGKDVHFMQALHKNRAIDCPYRRGPIYRARGVGAGLALVTSPRWACLYQLFHQCHLSRPLVNLLTEAQTIAIDGTFIHLLPAILSIQILSTESLL